MRCLPGHATHRPASLVVVFQKSHLCSLQFGVWVQSLFRFWGFALLSGRLQAQTGPCWKEAGPPPLKEERPSRLWSLHCACWIPGCQAHGELPGRSACGLFCQVSPTISLETTQLPTASPRCSVNHRPAPAVFALVGPSWLKLGGSGWGERRVERGPCW